MPRQHEEAAGHRVAVQAHDPVAELRQRRLVERDQHRRAEQMNLRRRLRHRGGELVADEETGEIAAHLGLRQVAGERTARSEEHTSELQSLMRNSYAVFCLKKKNKTPT